METRRSVHHKTNTLTGPLPSERNRRRRLLKRKAGVAELKTMHFERKQVANNQCVFCGNKQPNGRYNAICEICHTCQYCGLVINTLGYCRLCGNMVLDDSLKRKGEKRYRRKRVRVV